MYSTTKYLALIAPLTGLLMIRSASASPYGRDIDLSAFSLNKRQGDPSGVAPEDEDPGDINTDNTRALRAAVDARSLYTNQATATWYQVDIASSDAAASFTSFQTTFPSTSPIPPPSDTNQFTPPNPWNVDHIFELQAIVEAFGSNATKPSNIPDVDWSSASSAINTAGNPNAAIATAVSNLNNLEGIPNGLNSFKKQVFTLQLKGNGGPREGNNARYFTFFGPAMQKYLEDAQAGLMSDTVDKIGNQIQSAANNNADIKNYFTSYASSNYQGCINYLSTSWSGKATTRTTVSSTATVVPIPATTTAPSFQSCPTVPPGGWPDYGTCQGICQPSYQCVQYLASDPATWQCSCN